MEIEISGRLSSAEILTEDEFFDRFIDAIELVGLCFGGSMVVVSEELNMDFLEI